MTHQVAIVTPTKNRLALLVETMDSVAAQTFAGWEHIIVDDGSDDGTDAFVAERAKADPRVRYLRRTGEAAGAPVCRNLGLRQTRADLIVFLDSDDVLDPKALEQRVAAMTRNQDLDFVVFRTGAFLKIPGDVVGQVAEVGGDDLLRFLQFDLPWQTTAPTWRRAALERLGGFDETLLSWQDVDLHVRALAAGMRYLRYPRVDHFMRWQFEVDKISIQQRRSPAHLKAANAILAKFERVVREGPGMTWTRQRALAGLYFFVAERWVEQGHLGEALACWRQMRERGMAPAGVHLAGVAMLLLQGSPVQALARRLTHKWKGWARFRTDPELTPA